MASKTTREKRIIRHQRIRKTISGTSDIPRIAVYKSNTNIYIQIIDDIKQVTLISLNSKDLKLKNGSNKVSAKKLGSEIGKKMKAKKIKKAVFDRGGFLYHGTIKELADAIRNEGITI